MTLLSPAIIPGPQLNPLFGWRSFVIDFVRDPAAFLQKLHDRYGPIARAGQDRMTATFTFHPEYTRQLLSNPALFYSFGLEDVPFPFVRLQSLHAVSTALALINGDLHRQHRRMMAPAFNHELLPIYVNQINNLVENYFKTWQPGDVFDIYREMDLFTVSLAMEIFVGMPAGLESSRFAALFEAVLNGFFSPASMLLPYDLPGLPYHRLKQDGEKLESSLKDLINRRRARGLAGTDSLSLFLQARDVDGSVLTDNELIGETVAVFRGGSKTSAGALAWTLFLLSQHPAVLAQLTDELAGTLYGAPPTFEQLKQLPMLENIIKESLRLIPPVLWGARYSTAPCQLGPYPLPAGSAIVYSSFITHRLPELYPEPAHFKPSRWETIKPSPYEYLPFNAGPRRCLGAEFAMLELKITLAVLLQRFRFNLLPNQLIDRTGLTGSIPKHGLRMRLASAQSLPASSPACGPIHRLLTLPS